jgi:UDP:flavonoid glycosyltransferase YjiC (YdhE family)
MTPVGSAGDVNPFVALGVELRRRGHEVAVLTAEPFRETVESAGLEFGSVLSASRFEEALGDPDLWHPIHGIRALFRLIDRTGMERLWKAIDDRWVEGRSILVGHMLSFPTRVYEESKGVPAVTIQLAPIAFRTVHRQPVLPPGIDLDGWPRPVLRAFWWMVDRIGVDPLARRSLHDFVRSRGLEPDRRLFRSWVHSPRRVIAFFPGWFGPPQPDWPPQARLVGFPLFDGFNQAVVDRPLDEWLAQGTRPIVFAPGSANRQAARLFAVGAEATARSGHRALFVTPWGEQLPTRLPAHVRHVSRTPFSALFPRCAATVHHGGIGTTAQALRAGIPQVVVGGAFDQPDNGARLTRLGVGRRLSPLRLAPARLARMLDELLGDARAIGATARYAARMIDDASRPALERAADEVEAAARG